MKRLVLLLIAGCAAPPASGPTMGLGDAIDRLRQSASFVVSFEGDLQQGRSDPMTVKGRAERFRGGVLKVEREESGGKRERILRVGERAWIHHADTGQWVDPAMVGRADAGRGWESPDEVLDAVRPHSGSARFRDSSFQVTLTGGALAKALGKLGRSDLDYEASSADVSLWTDGRIVNRGEIQARLRVIGSSDPVHFHGTFKVESATTSPSMSFDDAGAPWTPEMKSSATKAVEKK